MTSSLVSVPCRRRGADSELELAPHSIRVNTIHPTTVAAVMIHNTATYRLFQPDLDSPTREDVDVAARSLNRLPVVELLPANITSAVLYLVSGAGRDMTGITTSSMPGRVLTDLVQAGCRGQAQEARRPRAPP